MVKERAIGTKVAQIREAPRRNFYCAALTKEANQAEATVHGFVDIAIIRAWIVVVYTVARHYWR